MAGEVGTLEELQAFERAAADARQMTPALKGILIEIANKGVVRYDWRYIQELIMYYIDQVILEYEAQSQVEIGPARPVAAWDTPAIIRQRLKTCFANHFPTEAPFTIQRLAELLLEPHKHYSRLNKLVFAIERLIVVTSTVPTDADPGPRPKLADLGPVNCNPKPVDLMYKANGQEGHLNPASGPGEGGYGFASSFLAVNSAGHSEERPELEEAMGHLNEAGMAADVISKHPPEVPQPDMDDSPGTMSDNLNGGHIANSTNNNSAVSVSHNGPGSQTILHPDEPFPEAPRENDQTNGHL